MNELRTQVAAPRGNLPASSRSPGCCIASAARSAAGKLSYKTRRVADRAAVVLVCIANT